jgi:hypothetical protein
MSKLFLKAIDTEELKREYESASSRTVKREWIKKGYVNQMSLYGVLTNTETKASEYRRIEILSNIPFTMEIVKLAADGIEYLKPPYKYSIWIYDKTMDGIKMVAHYD